MEKTHTFSFPSQSSREHRLIWVDQPSAGVPDFMERMKRSIEGMIPETAKRKLDQLKEAAGRYAGDAGRKMIEAYESLLQAVEKDKEKLDQSGVPEMIAEFGPYASTLEEAKAYAKEITTAIKATQVSEGIVGSWLLENGYLQSIEDQTGFAAKYDYMNGELTVGKVTAAPAPAAPAAPPPPTVAPPVPPAAPTPTPAPAEIPLTQAEEEGFAKLDKNVTEEDINRLKKAVGNAKKLGLEPLRFIASQINDKLQGEEVKEIGNEIVAKWLERKGHLTSINDILKPEFVATYNKETGKIEVNTAPPKAVAPKTEIAGMSPEHEEKLEKRLKPVLDEVMGKIPPKGTEKQLQEAVKAANVVMAALIKEGVETGVIAQWLGREGYRGVHGDYLVTMTAKELSVVLKEKVKGPEFLKNLPEWVREFFKLLMDILKSWREHKAAVKVTPPGKTPPPEPTPKGQKDAKQRVDQTRDRADGTKKQRSQAQAQLRDKERKAREARNDRERKGLRREVDKLKKQVKDLEAEGNKDDAALEEAQRQLDEVKKINEKQQKQIDALNKQAKERNLHLEIRRNDDGTLEFIADGTDDGRLSIVELARLFMRQGLPAEKSADDRSVTVNVTNFTTQQVQQVQQNLIRLEAEEDEVPDFVGPGGGGAPEGAI